MQIALATGQPLAGLLGAGDDEIVTWMELVDAAAAERRH